MAAWTVILLLTLLVVRAQMVRPRPETENGRLEQASLAFQARYLVGTARVLGEGADTRVGRQVEAWQPALPWQQVRVAIVAGEVIGPEAALQRLKAIKEPPQPADPPAGNPVARNVLLRLYADYSANELTGPSVADAEREQLQERLGWFGKLALAPPGSESPLREQAISMARRTFYLVIGGVVVLGIVGLMGLVLLVVFVALLLAGRLPGIRPAPGRSGVYAEAFACWLALFVVLSVAGGVLFGPEAAGAAGLLSMMGSMMAMGWPLMRGVSWPELCVDVGWTSGRRWDVELAAGVGCYAMAIPLILLAALLTATAFGLANPGAELRATAGHPAAEQLAVGTWWQRAQLLLLACVIAPIVEEFAFRGLLYRHLRDATGAMRLGSSVLLSAVLSSVLFALLHPQGWMAVPVLTAIAMALAFMREWRGTLVPSILAHGLNNAVVMGVLLVMLSK